MKLINRIVIILLLITQFYSCDNVENKIISSEDYKSVIPKEFIIYEETPKALKTIVDSIIKINILEYESITIAGFKGKNYSNFEELKQKASIPELITLTNNENEVVACYASWALADKPYSNLKTIFKKFLNQTRTVKTHSGCIVSRDHIASKLYHRYWNNMYGKEKSKDKILKELDSIILFQDEPYWLLLSRALENRIYKGIYKERIVELAFDKGDREALFYLNNWHKAEYYQDNKSGLLNYLKENDFKKTGTSDYYRTVEELLRFKNSKINNEIVEKMKKDKHWHHEPEKFRSLLDHHGIYYFSWSPN